MLENLRTYATFLLLVVVFLGCKSPRMEIPSSTAEASSLQMADAAEQFLAALSDEQRALAQFAFDTDAERTNWSNLPSLFVERKGIRHGDLTDEQRRKLHTLLRASTSSQGYQKIAGVIRLEDILHEEAAAAVEKGAELPAGLVESWTSDNYWISIFGNPAPGAKWGWQLSGHHLAANFTVVEDRLSFTPLFLGAEPNEIEKGSEAGWKVLSHEAERGFELLQALDSTQRSQAVLAEKIPQDVLTGPGRKGSLETFAGISASELNEAQKAILWSLVKEFVADVDHDAAHVQLDRIVRDGLDRLHFAWIGPQDDPNARFYYRVHGPSVLIEYVIQEGVGGEAANHAHSIIRDPSNDYGEDWLGKHYEEHHRRIR